MESAPQTGRSSPVRESSPKKRALSGGASISPAAARMESRMGRSYAVPAFLVSAGARLTVSRDTGQSKAQAFAAARTRSPASDTAPVGRPTTSSRGRSAGEEALDGDNVAVNAAQSCGEYARYHADPSDTYAHNHITIHLILYYVSLRLRNKKHGKNTETPMIKSLHAFHNAKHLIKI